MDNQLAEKLPYEDNGAHEHAIDVQGLEDLFQWASELVSEGLDGKSRRARDLRMKQQVLKIIHRNAGLSAKGEFQDELNYLQRRVIAMQGQLLEKMEELSVSKQVMVSQYCAMQRIPEMEEKVRNLEFEIRRLEAAKIDPSAVEAEKKELMTALTKALRERDYLDELLTVNETENSRLAKLLEEAREENKKLKARKWWQMIFRP